MAIRADQATVLPVVRFDQADLIVQPQLTPAECRAVLSHMPQVLLNLSKLEQVSYYDVVPVPGFDEYGNLDPNLVEWVDYKVFPRESDHPSRVLVGVSNGKTINLTPIPPTVSTDEQAVKGYQVHVFLHELFHTVGYRARKAEDRQLVKLRFEGETFSFQDWWQRYEEMILSGREPELISKYTNDYSTQLNQWTKDNEPDKFELATAEQICEAFVAYVLNIVPNNTGWANFREHEFGRNYSEHSCDPGLVTPIFNEKWTLMHVLWCAQLVDN